MTAELSTLDHVIRSVPPWRTATTTECGRPLDDLPVITRAELLTRVRTLGKQRAAFITCMTCWNTAAHNPAWEDNPAGSLARDFGRYGIRGSADALNRELRALTLLFEAHREEFEETLTALGNTTELDQARRKRLRQRPTQIWDASS